MITDFGVYFWKSAIKISITIENYTILESGRNIGKFRTLNLSITFLIISIEENMIEIEGKSNCSQLTM